MSAKGKNGMYRLFDELLVGLLVPPIVSALISTGSLPYYFILIIYGVLVYETYSLIREMTSWKVLYIIGWLAGLFILIPYGLLTPLDVIIFLFPVVVLLYRFYRWIKDQIR